ncbi:hypothetical protein PCL_08338 [Purpureocillium lilacinum]|uniref:Hemolysin-III family protein n=1 Tax=Purpureocillium lilacinum TaxID=33203 RepID=A0A2U3DRV8_PURLI|nr:hypothetical protein PCL_08338 [Purpureocillium lilacinum]
MPRKKLKNRRVPRVNIGVPSEPTIHSKPRTRTVTCQEISAWQLDNRYILSGYRPENADYTQIFTSLTFLHNETCNVHTHLIGGLLLPFIAIGFLRHMAGPQFLNVSAMDYAMFGMYFWCAEVCLILSALYHLLQPHSHRVELLWHTMDLLGIVSAAVGTITSGIYYVFPCEANLRKLHWAIAFIAGSLTGILCLAPWLKTSRWRKVKVAAFLVFGSSSFIPLIHGTLRYGLEYMLQYSGMKWYLLELAVYSIGVSLYMLRLPERLAPGKFDIWGSSHQIFHVAVMACNSTLRVYELVTFAHRRGDWGRDVPNRVRSFRCRQRTAAVLSASLHWLLELATNANVDPKAVINFAVRVAMNLLLLKVGGRMVNTSRVKVAFNEVLGLDLPKQSRALRKIDPTGLTGKGDNYVVNTNAMRGIAKSNVRGAARQAWQILGGMEHKCRRAAHTSNKGSRTAALAVLHAKQRRLRFLVGLLIRRDDSTRLPTVLGGVQIRKAVAPVLTSRANHLNKRSSTAASSRVTMYASGSSAQGLHPTEAGNSRSDDDTHRRTRRGPNNEEFLPHIVPAEAWKAPHKFGIPQSWIVEVDSTPDRSMTLSNDSWVREHRNWMHAHAGILELPAASDLQDIGEIRDAPGPIESYWNSAGDYESEAISARGQDRGLWWTLEVLRRDPDEFEMHIFKRFSAYGGVEVLENLFYQFSRTCRESPGCLDVWCEVEGLALYLKNYVGDFTGTDDTSRASDVVALLGALTIAALVVLDEKGSLRPDGDIPNIGFILSIMIERGWEIGTPFDARSHCTSWVYRVIDMADKAGIGLFGGRHFQDALHAIRKNEASGRTPYLTRKWDVVNFTQRLQNYKRKHQHRLPSHIPFRGIAIPLGIGGTNFDITRLPYEQRRRFVLECHSSSDNFDSSSSESDY